MANEYIHMSKMEMSSTYKPSGHEIENIPTLAEWWAQNLETGESRADYLGVYRKDPDGNIVEETPYKPLSGLDLFIERRIAHKNGDERTIKYIQSEFNFRREKTLAIEKHEAELIDTEQAKPNYSPNDKVRGNDSNTTTQPQSRPLKNFSNEKILKIKQIFQNNGVTKAVESIDREIECRRREGNWI